MPHYVGLDVSLEHAAVCVMDENGAVKIEKLVSSEPEVIADCLKGFPDIARLGLEAGSLAPWLYDGLARKGLPVFCIETRQMKAFAKASPVKTDKRDARLIAQAMRTGLFKATHVKTEYSQRLRLLLRHRQAMVRRNKELANTVRGTLKAFGVRVPKGKSALFAKRVREVLEDDILLDMTEPLLRAFEDGLEALARLNRMVLEAARNDQICRLLMTVPGVGAVTALAFRTGVDIPQRFDNSRMVGAIFGLTP